MANRKKMWRAYFARRHRKANKIKERARADKSFRNAYVMNKVFVVVFVGALITALVWGLRRESANNTLEEVQTFVVINEVNDSPVVINSSEEASTDDQPIISVDFEALWEINEDIYAWIYIPGTDVNYPILQSPEGSDQDYYLTHNLDGTYGRPACLYTQRYNSKTFTDFNTIIYGHNMRNGTMFASLHNYEDEAFFSEYKYVYICTPEEGVITYQVFAAYRTDNSHILLTNDFSSASGFASYLASVMALTGSNVNLDTEVEVTAEDTIITLSTCWASGMSEYRYVVQAVRID